MIRAGRVLWWSVLALAWMFPGAVVAGAQTLTVTTSEDLADPPFDAQGACGTGSAEDLPGADGQVSLREAIIAANNTAGVQSIVFAPALSGAALEIDFDNADADAVPNPLPLLCGGQTEIDGDLDADGVPDVHLVGDAALPPLSAALSAFSSGNRIHGLHVRGFQVGIGVSHVARFAAEAAFTGNLIDGNAVEEAITCIFVQGGSFDDPTAAGAVRDTAITRNTLSACSGYAIFVFTGDAPGSAVVGTRVDGNTLAGGAQFGVAIQANLSAAGSASLIDDTLVRANQISGFTTTGITAFSFAGRANQILGLALEDNVVVGNMVGVAVTAGACGARDSRLEATMSRNTVEQGIVAVGGSGFNCPDGSAPAQGNRLDVVIDANRVRENLLIGNGLVVLGGSEGAVENEVVALVSDNQAIGASGIAVVGGTGGDPGAGKPADRNRVDATVRGNAVGFSGVGLAVTGGGPGDANANQVTAQVIENASCGGIVADIQCYGGLPVIFGSPFPPNQGRDNRVALRVAENEASIINPGEAGVPDNACVAEIEPSNTPCTPGDANCDRRVTAADLIAKARLTAPGEISPCGLDAPVSVIVAALFGSTPPLPHGRGGVVRPGSAMPMSAATAAGR